MTPPPDQNEASQHHSRQGIDRAAPACLVLLFIVLVPRRHDPLLEGMRAPDEGRFLDTE